MRQSTRVNSVLASLLVSLVCAFQSVAQTPSTSYPKMAPLEQYLMDKDAEIAMARSAAPDAIARDASVLVLTTRGYQTVVQGKNGWTCIVDRGWGGMFDHPDFWNPKIRAAGCLNPAATRSVLPYDLKRTELVLAGLSKPEMVAATQAFIALKQVPALEAGAMCYMMSKTDYVFDQGTHTMSHVMFYTLGDATPLGANLPILLSSASTTGRCQLTRSRKRKPFRRFSCPSFQQRLGRTAHPPRPCTCKLSRQAVLLTV